MTRSRQVMSPVGGSARGTHAPRLLVSVCDSAEAEAAIAGGADWIDLKNPRAGPLGAVAIDTAVQIAEQLKHRCELSAAAGELAEWELGSSQDLLGVDAIRLVKLGLAACRRSDWQARWRVAQTQVRAHHKDLVAVIYADHDAAAAPHAEDIIELAAAAGARWLLWDTFDKSDGPLTRHLSGAALQQQLDRAASAGLSTVVAGGLQGETLCRLPLRAIDMVAVRGAACDAGRNGVVCPRRVAHFKQQVALAANASV